MPLEPFRTKWEAFGWNILETDGHDTDALEGAFRQAKSLTGKPTVIIANTIKGKGISYMEGQTDWHAGTVTKEQYEQGMRELEV